MWSRHGKQTKGERDEVGVSLYGVMKTDQIGPHETISKCNNSGKKDHREQVAEDGRRKRAKKDVGYPDSKKLMKRKTEDQEETPV